MILLIAFWLIVMCTFIFYFIIREERLSRAGKVPLGRLRRLWSGKDRRSAPRYRTNWPVHYRRIEALDIFPAKSRDFSQTGAGLIVHERLDVGHKIVLELKISESSPPLEVAGSVLWTKELPRDKKQINPIRLFFIGVKFDSLNPKDEQMLVKGLQRGIS